MSFSKTCLFKYRRPKRNLGSIGEWANEKEKGRKEGRIEGREEERKGGRIEGREEGRKGR